MIFSEYRIFGRVWTFVNCLMSENYLVPYCRLRLILFEISTLALPLAVLMVADQLLSTQFSFSVAFHNAVFFGLCHLAVAPIGCLVLKAWPWRS